MKREIAEKLAAEYTAFGAVLNRLTQLSADIEDEEARSAVRKGAFDAACSIYEGVRNALGPKYSSLLPPDH